MIDSKRYDILHNIAQNITKRIGSMQHIRYSLLGEGFGELLFLYYYSLIENSFGSIADSLLDRVFKCLNVRPIVGTYCNGLTGFAIGLSILEKDGFLYNVSDSLSELDSHIEDSLYELLNRHDVDFLHGFVGYGFYYLERYKYNPKYYGNRLRQILLALERLATIDKNNKSVKWQYNKETHNSYNISLSHGMSSIIILLCKSIDTINLSASDVNRVKTLIRQSVNYILSQRIDVNFYGSWFVSKSLDNHTPIHRSRLAWCYGDLGIAIALYDAAIALKSSNLKQIWLCNELCG